MPQWPRRFWKRPEHAQITWTLAALSNCAIHPMYLDEELMAAAGLDAAYEQFSEAMACFLDEVDTAYAAFTPAFGPDFVMASWERHLGAVAHLREVPHTGPSHRAAEVYTHRLAEAARRLRS